jgi:hypothetical protein
MMIRWSCSIQPHYRHEYNKHKSPNHYDGLATEGWIKDADLADDKTEKLWLRDRDLHKRLVQVEGCQGRVQIADKTE